MRTASETRQAARESFGEGRYWLLLAGTVVLNLLTGFAGVMLMLAGLVVSALVGAMIVSAFGVPFDAGFKDAIMEKTMDPAFMVTAAVFLFVALHVLLVPFVYVLGFSTWGNARMSLSTFRRELKFDQVFSGFGHGWKMGWIELVRGTYVSLWSLLFIVPGIVKAFSYALTSYVAVEHPDWTANECIAESCRLMEGNRWRCFCLGVSFIGWILLTLVASYFMGGLGQYFLMPYMSTSMAAFYEEAKERAGSAPRSNYMDSGPRSDYTVA